MIQKLPVQWGIGLWLLALSCLIFSFTRIHPVTPQTSTVQDTVPAITRLEATNAGAKNQIRPTKWNRKLKKDQTSIESDLAIIQNQVRDILVQIQTNRAFQLSKVERIQLQANQVSKAAEDLSYRSKLLVQNWATQGCSTLRANHASRQAPNNVYETLTRAAQEMVREGLIDSFKSNKIEFKSGSLIINGVRQSEKTSRKYRAYFIGGKPDSLLKNCVGV